MSSPMIERRSEALLLDLWVAGDDDSAAFAVTDRTGARVWHGLLTDDATLHPAWRRRHCATTVAAWKAIRIAGGERARLAVPSLLVRIYADVVAGSLDVLDFAAAKAGVRYELATAGGDNPARAWCLRSARLTAVA
ncbi:MAG: hypothetical protein HOQ24_05235 [Mycobacteriaceae bacterium]|nr:hypothetical protein [Mycobacteriaceae bacterium]